jgi:hypothetical protein
MSEPVADKPFHNGPTMTNRVTAGGTGTLLAVIVLWLLFDEFKIFREPQESVRDAFAGLIVVAYGGFYSSWLGRLVEAIGKKILRTVE